MLARSVFSDKFPLVLPACAYSDFGLHHIAPIHPKSGSVFLGELGKWVPTASARVVALVDSAASLTVSIVGVAGEAVQLAFTKPKSSGAKTVVSVVCNIGASAAATATFTSNGSGPTATCK